MKGSATRVGWEAGVAEKYGLNPAQHQGFFDDVWAEGFDPSTEDYENFDAHVQSALKYYRRGQEAAAMGDGSWMAAPSGKPRVVRPGMVDEFAGQAIELDDSNSARQWALTEYLHKTAALERAVMKFRSDVLGGPYNTLRRSEALLRLEAAEIARDDTPRGPTELVVLPEGDLGRSFRVDARSDWGRLSRLAGWLSRQYPWHESQSAAFVLCGDRYSDDGKTVAFPPSVVRVGSRQFSNKGHGAHPYHHAVITMEAASWVPWENVKEAYIRKQRELNDGKRLGLPSLRCIEVFRFVLERSTAKTVDRAENLARLALPPWRDLREQWDEGYPSGHAWRYGPHNLRNFRRDFGIGQAAVLGEAGGGLLGVPGEPSTPKRQVEVAKRRAAEQFRRFPLNILRSSR